MPDGRPGWRSRSRRGSPFVAGALWPFKGGTTVLGVDQWTAGELALCSIMRGIVDGGDPTKVREFVRWLAPSDFIQTEHLHILGALKRLVDAKTELSRDRLVAAIVPEDPG